MDTNKPTHANNRNIGPDGTLFGYTWVYPFVKSLLPIRNSASLRSRASFSFFLSHNYERTGVRSIRPYVRRTFSFFLIFLSHDRPTLVTQPKQQLIVAEKAEQIFVCPRIRAMQKEAQQLTRVSEAELRRTKQARRVSEAEQVASRVDTLH